MWLPNSFRLHLTEGCLLYSDKVGITGVASSVVSSLASLPVESALMPEQRILSLVANKTSEVLYSLCPSSFDFLLFFCFRPFTSLVGWNFMRGVRATVMICSEWPLSLPHISFFNWLICLYPLPSVYFLSY